MFDFVKKYINPHKTYTSFNVPDTLSHENRSLVEFISLKAGVYGFVFLILPLLAVFVMFVAASLFIPLLYAVFILLAGLPVFIVWFFLFGSAAKVDRTNTFFLFYVRCFVTDPHKKNKIENIKWRFLNLIYGRHPILKYKIPDNEFKKHFPINEIHDNGLIEFSDGHYGVMLKVDPPRSSSENTFAETLEGVFNTLVYGDMLKIMATSRYEKTTAYIDNILETANKPETPRSHRKHLQSLYNSVVNTSTDKINWMFKAVLVFDAEDTEDANIAVETRLPGLKTQFRAAGVYMYQMVNPLDIQIVYLQQLKRGIIKL